MRVPIACKKWSYRIKLTDQSILMIQSIFTFPFFSTVASIKKISESRGNMRKHIGQPAPPTPSSPSSQELNIADLATVFVTSEASDFPVENAFDNCRGPGGNRWVAAEPGEQTLTVAFDAPQTIQRITLEIEEQEVERTQELCVTLSEDGGQNYRELLRQEYTFSPSGATFEREEWSVPVRKVTHVQIRIKPDKGNRPCVATLTSLALQ